MNISILGLTEDFRMLYLSSMKDAEFIDTYLPLKPRTNTDEFGNLIHENQIPLGNSWNQREVSRGAWWQGAGRRIEGSESPKADPDAQRLIGTYGVNGNLR